MINGKKEGSVSGLRLTIAMNVGVAMSHVYYCNLFSEKSALHIKGKAIPLHAKTGPEGSRRLRLPDFKTVST